MRLAVAQLVPGVDRFGLVLGLLVLSYLVMALGGSSAPRLIEGSFAVVALWLALHASAVGPRVRLVTSAMLLAALVAVVVITQSVADNTARGVGELWFVVIFLLTLIAVLRRVLVHQEVTLETICGALSAYLLLGMMFAAVLRRAGRPRPPATVRAGRRSQHPAAAVLLVHDPHDLGVRRCHRGHGHRPRGCDPRGDRRPDLPRDAHRAPRHQLRWSPPDRLDGRGQYVVVDPSVADGELGITLVGTLVGRRNRGCWSRPGSRRW